MSWAEMKVLVQDGVQKFREIGFNVVAMVGDQGSNNINLIEKQLRVTVDQPFF